MFLPKRWSGARQSGRIKWRKPRANRASEFSLHEIVPPPAARRRRIFIENPPVSQAANIVFLQFSLAALESPTNSFAYADPNSRENATHVPYQPIDRDGAPPRNARFSSWLTRLASRPETCWSKDFLNGPSRIGASSLLLPASFY